MYYDTYRGKKKRTKKRRSCLGWLMSKLFRLIILALILAILAAGLLYILPVGVMNVEPANMDLSPASSLDNDTVNILLLGLDFQDEGHQRSDAIMIASVSNNGVKLGSLMRDTMVEIPGQGQHKLNSAYSYGGAEMVMRVINQTFRLNITNYIAVDLRTLVDAIDAVGGVKVNVSDKEIEQLNKIAWDTYKKISSQDGEKYSHYAASAPITQPGDMLLNGLFATSYSRIRAVDSDYMRTARQREVLSGVLAQVRENCYDPRIYLNLLDVARNSIDTNLSLVELISLGEKVLISGQIDTNRFPENAYILDNGSSIEITDPEGCIRSLHEFIYNENAE